MFFADRLTLDKPRRNDDGYMAVHARAARTGIYQYLGREVDPEGKHFAADQIVNVYRPPEEVFDKASLGSFVGKPITDDHPAEGVSAANWRNLARGTIMGAARDGEFVGFDLAFMDAALITAIDEGKRELSNGYAADLSIEDGETPDGTKYQAVQRSIRGNHVAVVDAGRAGSSCCIMADAASCAVIPSDEVRKLLVDQRTYDANRDGGNNRHNDDAQRGEKIVPKLILIDGHQIDIANVDVAEATINKLIADAKAATEAKTGLETQVATLTTDLATSKATITTLEKQLADAKVTPAMLREAGKSFADVTAKAKALGVTVADDLDEGAIKRAVVDAKLGDDAKGWNDEQIAASFAALTKDTKAEAAKGGDALADAIGAGIKPAVGNRQAVADARRAALAAKESAYLGQQPN